MIKWGTSGYEINLTNNLFIQYIEKFMERLTKAKIHISNLEKKWDKMKKYGLAPS